MGLKKGAGAIYLGIVAGKLARRFKLPNENTMERKTTEGNIVYEEYFKSLDGTLVGLDKRTHEQYGDSLLVYIKGDSQLYCVQMQMSGRYAMNFLKTLPNVDIEKDIELTPFEKQLGEGKTDSTIFVRQDGLTLKRFFTKDNPHDLPEPVQRKKGKKLVWEWDNVIEFLEENVYTPFKEGLKNKSSMQLPESDAEYLDAIIPDNSDLNA